MTRYLLLAAFLALPLACTWAQSLQPGIKAGASFPDLTQGSSQRWDYNSRMAPFFGISVSQNLSGILRLQEELNYSPQGGRRTGMQQVTNFANPQMPQGTTAFASYKDEIRINYLELPVLLQLFAEKPQQDGRKVFYFVNFGPYVSLLLNARHVTKGNSLLYADEEGRLALRTAEGLLLPERCFNSTMDIGSRFKKWNAGIVGGIGTGYNFSGQKFFFEARFTRGLINIHANNPGSEKINTASLVFTAGYVYSFE